ncbi:MAG: GNAT family N-acetyltransferase [Bacteroidaceae bacterium]|nr:GNAT family N-acetyltransferase [Bacteroidaceae bacterium]
MELIIKQAGRDDAKTIAQAVSLAFGDDMMYKYCGKSGKTIIEALAGMNVSQYSYRNALIAYVNGVAAGAIVGYDGAMLQQLKQPTLSYIHQQTGTMLQITDETQAGEFYLDTLAVFPAFRHQGVAKQLILAFCENASIKGHQHVGLLVDVSNPQAEELYHSLGFKRINRTTLFDHSLWHMQKVLLKATT